MGLLGKVNWEITQKPEWTHLPEEKKYGRI